MNEGGVARLWHRVLLGALAVAILTAGVGALPGQAATDPISRLHNQIMKALQGSTSHAGGFFVTLSGVQGAAQLNATTPFIPASNQKIYTALAVLLQLDPNEQLVTSVRRTGPVVDGELRGDLVLRGVGDPLLSASVMKLLAGRVAQAGIHRVTGSLWADDTRYDRVRSAPGWKPDYVPKEIGPLSALAMNENGWRTDLSFIRNPASANANWFRGALKKVGVRVVGPTRLGKPRSYSSVVTLHYSWSIATLVHRMLKESDNFIAEELLKEAATRPHVPGSTAGGVSVVWQWAARLGISPGTAFDGSGLSWWDRETPRHEVRWLRAAELSRVGAEFTDSLPIACVDGTLKDRFCGTPAAGKVSAKTGTLPGVVCLAGYTTTASGRHVRFAFMLNQNDSNYAARQAVDRAVVAIVSFNG
jgi:D-alanyl-D-alanine carboxypeptidase/D-alanyl-D-alanine-endopeptidase (penicillin-binding protein 4)